MADLPSGYDDQSVVPQQRMVALLDRFEERLDAVQRVFNQHFPGEFKVAEDFQGDFWHLQHSAEELGTEHLNFVKDLMTSYKQFQSQPDPDKLKEVYSKLKRLKKFLKG